MKYKHFKQAVESSDIPHYGKYYNFTEYYQYVSGIHEITYDLDCTTWFYTSNKVSNTQDLLVGTGRTLSEAIETYRSYGKQAV